MSTVVAYSSALAAIFERDLRVFMSYRTRALTQLISLILTMTIFYYVSRLVNVEQFRSPDEYFAFVVAGLLIMYVLQSAMAAPALLRHELVAGTFERSLTSPLGPVASTLALMLFPIAFACFIFVAGFLLAAAIFSLPVEWSTAPAAIPAALLCAFAFGTIATLALAAVVVFKQASGIGWVVTLLALTGGVYFPVSVLPDWVAWISAVQPFTPAVDLLRHLMLGVSVNEPAGTALLKLVGFIVILGPLSGFLLRSAIQTARRRGTILEF